MTITSIIGISQDKIDTHLLVNESVGPDSLARSIAMAKQWTFAKGKPTGSFAIALITALMIEAKAIRPWAHGQQAIGLVAGWTDQDWALRYELMVTKNDLAIKAYDRAGDGEASAADGGGCHFEGDLVEFMQYLGLDPSERPRQAYLAEVTSIENDVYQRVFVADASEAERFGKIVKGVVRVKGLAGGAVVPLLGYEPRFGIADVTRHLSELCGDQVVEAASPKAAQRRRPRR